MALMNASTTSKAAARRPFGAARVPAVVRASTVRVHASSRRDALLAGGALVASPLLLAAGAEAAQPTKFLPVENLGNFQRRDQVAEFSRRAQATAAKYLTAEDAPAAVRLVLRDAVTYDAATKTGGLDASIILNSDEAGRPENADLKPYVAKLKAIKKEIDENDKAGAGPISWADLMVVAGKVAMEKQWLVEKTGEGGAGKFVATQFKADFPLRLGRLDSSDAAPAIRAPPATASPEEIKSFLLTVGQKGPRGPFDPKPPLWEKPGFLLWTRAAADPAAEEARLAAADPAFRDVKRGFDISRETVSRTEYEVSFVEAYTKLVDLGAKYAKDAYLYPIPIVAIKA